VKDFLLMVLALMFAPIAFILIMVSFVFLCLIKGCRVRSLSYLKQISINQRWFTLHFGKLPEEEMKILNHKLNMGW